LIEFRGQAPSRRIAMVWRRSSAIARFLTLLAEIFKALPRDLLDAHSTSQAPRKRKAKTA
ncbi:MAG: DNA-binding transcriptional regulator OxyR, partial [Dokdonella sp.]